jgi:cell division septation protein DedD
VKKNEDGEVELILGNGQLLGVFFIVVILLGLFFGMGYIMGRNSGAAASVEIATAPKAEPKPATVESPAPQAAPPEASALAPAPPEPKEAEPKEAAKPAAVEDGQARSTPGPAAAENPSGAYLQLAATTKREAELEVDVLRRKNFRAMTMEVPEKPGTFRVLVGPISDGGVNKTRDDLQAAGFPGRDAIIRKF